jgi:hypothetical protein
LPRNFTWTVEKGLHSGGALLLGSLLLVAFVVRVTRAKL